AREEAKLLVNGPPPPDPRRDYVSPPLSGTPHFLLSQLAHLWVRSDPKDEQGKLIEQARPHLALARRTVEPVRIGRACDTSIAATVLLAAQWLTTYLGNSCGCGRLVGIVQASFPRESPADPWDLGQATAVEQTAALIAERLGDEARRSLIKD